MVKASSALNSTTHHVASLAEHRYLKGGVKGSESFSCEDG